MDEPIDLKLKVDNAKLKKEVSDLRAVVMNSNALLASKEKEVFELRTQIDILSKKAANFQELYFAAAKLGERTTTSHDPQAN